MPNTHVCLSAVQDFLAESAFLFHHFFLKKLQQTLVLVVVPALGFISVQ